ncbi:MAG: rhomboid family intrarane serine protease [Flavipsychrobacter sp.]|nr:rhomboid family intrarane serine protease [Flavipsychrobacter sp.]
MFIKELSTGYLTPTQYLSTAIQAIKNTGWQIVSLSDNTMICHTRGIGNSLGESVTITLANGAAIFTSRSMNEYYLLNNQNEENYVRYMTAFTGILTGRKTPVNKFNPQPQEPYGALVPSKTYLVTPLLIYTNAAIFICMVLAGLSPFSPAAASLFTWGGNFRPAVLQGDWWRLITHMFLHGGIMHLLMNMFSLLYIGMYLEPLLGKFRFTTAYIITGICGGLLSLVFHANSVGVGASGAIFGMYGVFLAILTTGHIQKTMRKTMLRSILFFVVYNLGMGMQGNIDNAAHIGGLLSGLIIGYVYYPYLKRMKKESL